MRPAMTRHGVEPLRSIVYFARIVDAATPARLSCPTIPNAMVRPPAYKCVCVRRTPVRTNTMAARWAGVQRRQRL